VRTIRVVVLGNGFLNSIMLSFGLIDRRSSFMFTRLRRSALVMPLPVMPSLGGACRTSTRLCAGRVDLAAGRCGFHHVTLPCRWPGIISGSNGLA